VANLVHNERVKLRATLFNTAAGSCIALGILAPIVAAFYGLGTRPPLFWLLIGAIVWLTAAGALHAMAHQRASARVPHRPCATATRSRAVWNSHGGVAGGVGGSARPVLRSLRTFLIHINESADARELSVGSVFPNGASSHMSFKLAIATAILLAAGVSLGACAVHNWEPGPGVDAADFDAARARCSIFARHSGGGFVAIGSENYVAGATLGHAIGETVRTQRDFNDCMLASGWRIADARSAATPGESDWTKGLWWGAKNRDPSACDAPPLGIINTAEWKLGCHSGQGR
jgi:hypothetical protein